ncbi:hypothetical protein Tco_0988858 [Tanacetum coccineum]|uniref:Uncharacterized protein n=1 Tax=Tanacetum coccineum TaxID=301880 RepID=A0ABQ5ESH7_9ASTR
MAQQIILAAQLVPKFQSIRRCNNYVVLQSIPCSLECKIIGQILLDRPLIYALTVHCMHVLACNLTIIHSAHTRGTSPQVPDTKATIKFQLDSQEITYTVDMFHDTLKLPVGTPDNPFITPVNIKVIKSFMQTAGYQGVVDKVSAFYTKFLAQPWQTMFKVFNHCLTTRTSEHDQTKINLLQLFHIVVNHTNVDYVALLWWDLLNCVFQKKDVITYPRFTKLVIADLMKKYPSIPKWLEEDYHSIKDDILLVSVYSTRNVLFQGMPISDAFLTDEIRVTDDYTEAHKTPTLTAASPQGKKMKQTKNTSILPPSDDRERDEITEATLLSLTLHKTALAAEAQENVAKVQEKLAEEEIENMVKGEENEESYASEFADSMRNEDVDDSGTRIELRHKENPKVVNDDDVTKKKDDKKDEDEEKYDDVEKTDNAAEEKDNDDPTDHTLSQKLLRVVWN